LRGLRGGAPAIRRAAWAARPSRGSQRGADEAAAGV